MPSNKLDDYIVVFKNALSDSLCDSILNEYSNKDEYVPATVGSKDKTNTEVRKVKGLNISQDINIGKNREHRQNLDSELFAKVGEVINNYTKKFNEVRVKQDCGYSILKYEIGDFYKQHTDSFTSMPRELSCSIALNDDYEGGEFGFFDRKKTIKMPKGSALVFPSNFMYPHEILPVKSGTRYSIITWLI